MTWKLHIGLHRGTITSRDSDVKTQRFDGAEPLQSLEDCIECAKAWQNTWRGCGYYLWYANAISPEGEKHVSILPGVPYH
jgi:hypothetical protein